MNVAAETCPIILPTLILPAPQFGSVQNLGGRVSENNPAQRRRACKEFISSRYTLRLQALELGFGFGFGYVQLSKVFLGQRQLNSLLESV